jgi:hypothetical protein
MVCVGITAQHSMPSPSPLQFDVESSHLIDTLALVWLFDVNRTMGDGIADEGSFFLQTQIGTLQVDHYTLRSHTMHVI